MGYRIESNEEINSDNDSLVKDMFRGEYPENYIIDVGWYSGIDKFIIYVIYVIKDLKIVIGKGL